VVAELGRVMVVAGLQRSPAAAVQCKIGIMAARRIGGCEGTREAIYGPELSSRVRIGGSTR
jgi:hypothetical protein